MRHPKFITFVHILIIVSMVFGQLTPALLASSRGSVDSTSDSLTVAPSDRADDWTGQPPDVSQPTVALPNVEPETWAFDEYLPADMTPDGHGGHVIQVDPFIPNPVAGLDVARPTDLQPQAPNPIPDVALNLPPAYTLDTFLNVEEDTSSETTVEGTQSTTQDTSPPDDLTNETTLYTEPDFAPPKPETMASPTQSHSNQNEYTLYLPAVMKNVTGPRIQTILLQPDQPNQINDENNGLHITFSEQAVAQDTTVRYTAYPRSTMKDVGVGDLQIAGPAFSLSAWDTATGATLSEMAPQVTLITSTIPPTEAGYLPTYALVTPNLTIALNYNSADLVENQNLDLRTLALYGRANATEAWQPVPSAVYQDQQLLVAEVSHLQQFIPLAQPLPAITTTPIITMRIALDPDDNVGHATWPDDGYITELPKNVALAEGVKTRLENDCQAVVMLTRNGDNDYVSRSLRADSALNFEADFFVTLAFNALTGHPWGLESNGGVIGWARNGQPTDDALVNETYNRIQEYTGRPHRRPVLHPSLYGEFNNLPAEMTYAHIETLFLDHNYDWPVIRDGFEAVADGMYVAIRTQLEAQGMTCYENPGNPDDPGQPTPLPAPPSAEQLQKWRDLGYQNYQRYGADPVSFSTGNYIYQHTLFTLPAPGAVDLDFTLTYNSQDGRDDLFGLGWTFPYAAHAQRYSDNSVSIVLADGRTYHYQSSGESYEAPPGVFDTLTQNNLGWEWTAHDGTILTFTEADVGFGVLTEWRDRNDNTLTFEYDFGGTVTPTTTLTDPVVIPRPALTTITDNTGREILFEADGEGHLTQMTLLDGRTFTFEYEAGQLVSITDPNEGTRQFEYDADGRLTKHYDPEGIMYLENIYDEEDRVVEQIDASGSHMFLTYDEDTTTFTDNLGHISRYEYDDLNRVTAVVDALNNREEFEYDDAYNLVAYTDKRGHTWDYTYDERGNRLTETDPLDQVTSYTYNEANDLTSLTDALGRTTTFTYDESGNLLETIRPDGSRLSYTYDAFGQLLSVTDANNHTTHYEYDDYGNLTTITDPLGHQTHYTYDLMGRQLSMTDANGHVAQFEYDGNDNIIAITDPKGASTTFGYDKNDNLTTLTDRLGRVSTYEYDENLKLVRETNPAGEVTTYDYDLMYNLINLTDALNHTTTYRYDALYQRLEVENALGGITSYSYDENGNVTSLTDANEHSTTYTYDLLNRLEKMTDALGGETTYGYDAVSNLIEETNPRGAVTGYEYDDLNRLILRRDALNGLWQTDYDAMGNVIAITNANGHATTYHYDDADRLQDQTDANGNTTTFTYDAVGNLTQIEDALGRLTDYAYDANDNLSQITDALGGQTIFTYDAEDNLQTRTNANNQTTHYAYDPVDRVLAVTENYQPGQPPKGDTNALTAYEYDAMGNVTRLADANGYATTYQYDALYRLTSVTDAENQTTAYEYDPVANLTRLTNPRGYATTYTYNPLDRMIAVTDAHDESWLYAYDPIGNLTEATDPLAVVTHYEYDLLDRLTSLTQNYRPGDPATVDQNVRTVYHYDPVGNLRVIDDPRGGYQTEHRYNATNHRVLTVDAEGGETEFIYDAVYNLISVIDGNDHATNLTYDHLNRQVMIANPEGHTVGLVYDPIGNVLQVTDARGYDTTFTYDGLNRLILRVDALAGEWYFSYDRVGTLLSEIDANGHANNTYTYDKVYRLLRSTDAEGYRTRFTYDENGNQLTLTDGNDHTTTYTYDALDRLVSLTNAENETTRYTYDPLGNQTALIEADDILTRYDYDPLYRLVTVTENYRAGAAEGPDVNVDTHYGYDEVGNLLTILNAEDYTTTFSYDGLNRLIQEVDALGNTWTYAYDFVGNRLERVDANGDTTTYRYYPDDQLQDIAYADGTAVTYTYDENNNRLTMADRLGDSTWVYDPLNRMTDQTDPFGRHLGYAYDPVGNRTALTYADGRTVQYTYYANNWLKKVTDPEGNVTTTTRDGVGQTVRSDNPNQTVAEMTYDKADRLLTLVNYQVGGAAKTNSAFTYTYDEVGQRTEVVTEYAWRNPSQVVNSYTYDGVRRLIVDEDSEGRWTTYEFDRVGNRLRLQTNDDSLSPRPFDEKTLVYSYNAINQLLTIIGDTHPGNPGLKRAENTAQPLHAFSHEVAAQQGKHISPTAAADLLAQAEALLEALYDQQPPAEEVVAAALTTLHDAVQAYADSGEIDRAGIANSLLVKLNLAGEANAGVNKALQTTTFTYDANGNRLNKEYPGPQGPQIQGTDYTYDPENRLARAQDYQMNQQGNRVDRAVTTTAYDGLGRRLVKVYDPKTGPSTRSGQVGGDKRVEYVYDGLDPVAEYNIWNPQYDNFYRGDLNRIITMHHIPSGTQGQMYWYHYDGLGSTAGLTKHNGNSHHNYRYESYGQIEMPPGNFTNPHNHYTFTGQELDEHMALYEFYARAYDYDTGTWMQQDVYRGQVKMPRSLHRYGYVENSPVNYWDWYGYKLGFKFIRKFSIFMANITLHSEWELWYLGNPYEDGAISLEHIEAQNQYNLLIWDTVQKYFPDGDRIYISRLVKRQIGRESQCNPNLDNGYAAGLMGLSDIAVQQVMKLRGTPDKTIDRFDPEQNIDIGVDYLHYLYNLVVKQDNENGWQTTQEERWKFTLAIYNAGPYHPDILPLRKEAEKSELWSSIASNAPTETQKYVKDIFFPLDKPKDFYSVNPAE